MGFARFLPHLGFDPTPGDREAVAEHLRAALRTLKQVDEAANRLKDAVDVSDHWVGAAAQSFSKEGDDLALGLEAGKRSLVAVGNALDNWLQLMTANQQSADILERQMKELDRRLAEAKQPEDIARINHERELTRGVAKRLEAKHLRDARATAAAIDGTSAEAFVPVETKAGMELLKFVSTASGEISKWSGTLGTISMVVPGGQTIGGGLLTLSAASGGVKSLSDAGMIVTGHPDAPKLKNVVLNQVTAGAPVRWAKGGADLTDKLRRADPGRRWSTAADQAKETARNTVRPAVPDDPWDRGRAAAEAVAGLPADGIDTYNTITGDDVDSIPFRFAQDAARIRNDGVRHERGE